MKLNVAEREGKGDKGISGEQEARGAREEGGKSRKFKRSARHPLNIHGKALGSIF